MSTGNIENWSGEIADIGAIYPFVGTETLLVIVAIVLWVAWHVKQTKDENAQLAKQESTLQDKAHVEELIDREYQ